MKVAFFHGLESSHKGAKYKFLISQFGEENVYAKPMNYRDPKLFENTLKDMEEFKPDYVIGSSMGGWFSFCIATNLGCSGLLFNPAVQGRSIEPLVKVGNKKPNFTVVLGTSDKVINPEASKIWFYQNYDNRKISYIEERGMEHRIPISIFSKWTSRI